MDEPRNPLQLDAEIEGEILEEENMLTRDELARELVELLDELASDEMLELVDKNVPPGALEFFTRYASDFARGLPIGLDVSQRLPNLMVLGYLLRLLEDRLIDDPEIVEG